MVVANSFQVLHATKNLRKTLENCRRLLKPGGSLVLGENTNPNDISSFIFGTLPGWWVSEDGREDGPLLSQSEWDVALKEAGFSTADVRLPEIDRLDAHRMSVLVSTRHEEHDFSSRDVMIVTPDDCTGPTSTLASLIRCEFERLGSKVEVRDIQTAATSVGGKTVVSLLEYERPFLEEIEAAQFEQAKQVLLHSAELLWVTRSDSDDRLGHPSRRIISGLLRCVKQRTLRVGCSNFTFAEKPLQTLIRQLTLYPADFAAFGERSKMFLKKWRLLNKTGPSASRVTFPSRS